MPFRLRRQTWLAGLSEIGFGALLVAAGLRVLSHLEASFDIGLFDETRYLLRGWRLEWADLPHLYRAPLYAVWYALLARRWPDPLLLHDGNFRLQVLLLPLEVYGLLRVVGWPRGGAFVVAWFFLVSDANLVVWPRVASFAWLLLLPALAVALRWRHPQARRGVLLLATWLTVYARPEMLLAVALLLAEAGFTAWRTRREATRSWLRWARGGLLVGALSLAVLGSPLREQGRLKAAFLQHVAYRLHTQYGRSGGAWDRWREVGQEVFGTDASLWQAITHNPAAFRRHLQDNGRELLPKAGLLMFGHVPLLCSVWNAALLAALLWLLTLIGGTWWRRRHGLPWPRPRPAWGWALALALPGLGSAVLIYPRRHYLLGAVLMLWLAWAAWLAPWWQVRRSARHANLGIVAGWVLALGLVVYTQPLAARFPCPAEPPRLGSWTLPRSRQWLCRRVDVRPAILALRRAAAQRGPLRLAIDRNFWDENLEVYLPAQVEWAYPAPRAPEKLLILPADVIVEVAGPPWLNQPARRAALQTLRAQGGSVYCTPGTPWILIFRQATTVPLQPCPLSSP